MLGGTTRIIDLDGEEMLFPINIDRLWRYNFWKKKKKKPSKLKTQKSNLGKN